MPPPAPSPTPAARVERLLGVTQYTRRALTLLWETNPRLGLAMVLLSLLAAVLPAAAAYVGKLIVDGVIQAADTGAHADRMTALTWVGVELAIVALLTGAQRGLSVCESLLRAQLGQRVSELILQKAVQLGLSDFENSELYDKLSRARREAALRPLNLVRGTLELGRGVIAVLAAAFLLLGFSVWLMLLLITAALPGFLMNARFSADAFRLFRWRSPEARRQRYLETVLGRDDHAKEVQLYDLGPTLLDRHRTIYEKLYAEDRKLTIKRGVWGFVLGVLSAAALYASYAWIAWDAIDARITVGAMTMYLLLFKQAQGSINALLTALVGMYADNLYVSTLYEFLEHPIDAPQGTATQGIDTADGVRFENVSFSYPDETEPALHDVSLHIPPGTKLALVGENGAGKTTLIKLLTRLYRPTEGRILLDGIDLREWDRAALYGRIGVIFQDFVRYQFVAGDNIGVGDVAALEDRDRWQDAATRAGAHELIERLPQGYDTQLGKWFEHGHQLSLGQWQKVALARSLMRSRADILVLDEPTASLDAEAEAEIFQRFREMTADRTAILISHRFSTVRMADQIVVLKRGRITEQGTHDALLAQAGRYAHLFGLQAAQYR